jgi:YHS domain-containing protein
MWRSPPLRESRRRVPPRTVTTARSHSKPCGAHHSLPAGLRRFRPRRNQFLISDDVRCNVADVDVDTLGPVTLKGVAETVELFAVRTAVTRSAKATDPVCGMELDDSSSEANLGWHGRQIQFCSEDCLRRFLNAPEHYARHLALG